MMTEQNSILLTTDSDGRINISDLANGATTFRATCDANNRIILEPEIPQQEKWLYKNQESLASVRKGIQDFNDRKTLEACEDFTQYIEDEN